MFIDNKLARILGVQYPIIQAPMAGASTPLMASAAANAGCVGSLGCAMMSAEIYKQNFDACRAQSDGVFNMNFFCHAPHSDDAEKAKMVTQKLAPFYKELGLGDVPQVKPTHFPFGAEMLEAVLKSCPQIVSFHFGLSQTHIVKALKEAGCLILSSATTREEAIDLEIRGADIIVAQGWEAGGHQGYYLKSESSQIGLMSLLPQIVDSVSVPVIAAGGIADGRGVAAAFMLGASGVQLGTSFLTCAESEVARVYKDVLMDAEGEDTEMTRAFSGRPARGITNKYIDYMRHLDSELPDFPLMNTLTGPLKSTSAKQGSSEFMSLWAGQSVGLVKEKTIAEFVEQLVADTQSILAGK